MMKRFVTLALLMQIAAVAAYGETKEGTCQLKPGKGFEKDLFQVQVGETIKGTCRFFIFDFVGKKVINAAITILNTGDKAMHCQYYVAFFDKDGNLIGCAGQGTFGKTGLAAGQSTQLGSCLIPLPAGFHEKAVQYKIAFYESDKEIGKDADGEAPKRNVAEPRPDATAEPQQSTALVRKWTDTTGKFTVDAELVDSTNETVHLKKRDGQVIALPLEKLSGADQEYIRSKVNRVGTAPANRRADKAGTDSVSIRPQQSNARTPRANTRTQQVKWYSVGPAWEELNSVVQSRGISVQSTNHGEKQYAMILSQSQPGSTIVLLFTLDRTDERIPESYQDLLPMPWAQIEATLQKGGTVEASGQAREREIVLLAAPKEWQLKELIRTTKLLSQNPANR